MPLVHPPGDAQADFGEALVVVDGVERKAHYLVVDLPHSDDAFVKAFPAETTEAFCEGHNAAFHYARRRAAGHRLRQHEASGGTDSRGRHPPADASLQRTPVALPVRRPLRAAGQGQRQRQGGRAGRLRPPQLVRADSTRRQLGRVERRLGAAVQDRRGQRLRRHTKTIGERFARDRAALLPLPPVPYEACDTRPTRVTSLSLVRYRRNDYSVPTAYGHREVVVKGFVDEVVIVCGSEEIARHRRSYEREALIFEPRHYLALLERKIGALDQAAPLAGWTLPEAFGRSAAAVGSSAGPGGDARVRAGVATPRGLSARPRQRRYPGRPALGRDRVRRRQASGPVPPRTPAAPPRPGAVSASAGPARDDDRRGRLPGAVGGRSE